MVESRAETLKRGYPVGSLDDIRLYFMHYQNFELARNKWYERCKRIQWNNLFFIMVQRDGCTERELKLFDEYPSCHKALFVTRPRTDIKCSYYIPGTSKNGEVIDLNLYKGKFTGKRWIDDFDYVHFLNGNEKNFR